MSRGEVYLSAFSGSVLAQQPSLVKRLVTEARFPKNVIPPPGLVPSGSVMVTESLLSMSSLAS